MSIKEKLAHNNQGIELLKRMLLQRAGDAREAVLLRQGKCWSQLAHTGHEGLMAVAFQLRKEDYLFTYYRGGHMMTAKGLSKETLALDYLARKDGFASGRNQSQVTGSTELNIFPDTAHTGSQSIPSAGCAWGMKMNGTDNVVLCCIGDGSTREGDFYEGISFAFQEKLPIIYLVEDNGLAISTRTDKMNPFRIGIFNEGLFKRINGRDTLEVWETAEEAIAKARSGGGPTIIWAEVDRHQGHTIDEDHLLYRHDNEIANFIDPIEEYGKALIRRRLLTRKRFEEMKEEAEKEVFAAYEAAEAAESPSGDSARTHVFGAPVKHTPMELPIEKKGSTMVEDIIRVFEKGLEEKPELLFFGQDVEDPKGGVFGFTKTLSTKFPGRVINSPLAESTIIGSAIGVSQQGYRPVFEIQFIDFLTCGFDQLVNHASSLHWRTVGKFKCPMVVFAAYGAYIPSGGMWHSQSNEAWYTHTPGLRVAIPSTPQDAAGLFWTAFEDDDVSLILIPKHTFRKRRKVESYGAVPWGKARVAKEGSDVTIVTWGNGVDMAAEAANIVADDDISVEVLDLRTLVPCDWDAIVASVRKTSRMIVFQEDNRTSSFGASLIAEMMSREDRFELFEAPPAFVVRDDIHIPYHPEQELDVMPTVQDIVDSIYANMDY